jgi:hypothetical protein
MTTPPTREEFLAWRSPRPGAANPERMNNPAWEWLIDSRTDAYHATKQFDGPSPFAAGPGWCFTRFGQSTTELPDGRVVLIAGEHEDSYDPDFFIYNDVVVRHPDGRLDIFGYPRDVFPPTDFHSATLVGDRIVIIGNLGYPAQRRHDATQVLVLDTTTFAVTITRTTGTPPGWIHSHDAELSEGGRSIVITKGKLERSADESLVENIDDWRLHLDDWRWERLTERRWQRYEVRRADGGRHHLFDYEQLQFSRHAKWHDKATEELAELTEELGGPPDLEAFARLYSPSVAHEPVPREDEQYDTTRIAVDGVVVRYVDTMGALQLTVEGDLPQLTIDALTTELRDRLAALERAPCELRRL